MHVAWEKGCYSSALNSGAVESKMGAAHMGETKAGTAREMRGVRTLKRSSKNCGEENDDAEKFWSGIDNEFSLFKGAQAEAHRRVNCGEVSDDDNVVPTMMVHEYCFEYLKHKRKTCTGASGTRMSRFEALRVALLRLAARRSYVARGSLTRGSLIGRDRNKVEYYIFVGDESAVYGRSSCAQTSDGNGGGSGGFGLGNSQTNDSTWSRFHTVARLHSLLLSLRPHQHECDAQLLCELRRHYAYIVRAIRAREAWAENVSLAATARTASLITECNEQSEKLSRLVCQELNGRGRSRSLGRSLSSGTSVTTVEDEERALKRMQGCLAESRAESDRVYQWYQTFKQLYGNGGAVPAAEEQFRFWPTLRDSRYGRDAEISLGNSLLLPWPVGGRLKQRGDLAMLGNFMSSEYAGVDWIRGWSKRVAKLNAKVKVRRIEPGCGAGRCGQSSNLEQTLRMIRERKCSRAVEEEVYEYSTTCGQTHSSFSSLFACSFCGERFDPKSEVHCFFTHEVSYDLLCCGHRLHERLRTQRVRHRPLTSKTDIRMRVQRRIGREENPQSPHVCKETG